MTSLETAMGTLADNLTTAAMLCRAFYLGRIHYNWSLFGKDAWCPGCGRPAP